jgi:cellular nucleic acid-binding protein
MEQIYVLQCKNGKYYVGKTADVMRRFEEHKSGNGSAWTKKYPPTRLMECRAITGSHDENNMTKDLMKKYGVDNVRGGTYTQISLPDELVKALNMESRGNADVCYKCNLAGHFANKCPGIAEDENEDEDEYEEVWGCEYCNREFTTQYGCMVHERSCKKTTATVEYYSCEMCEKEFSTERAAQNHECRDRRPASTITCYRCGHHGHKSPECYAKKHIKGYLLD